MRRTMRRWRTAFPAFLILVAVALSAGAETLTILYTNDLHLRFARLLSIERWIEAERAEGVGPVLLVDAGDTWQDTRTLLSIVWGADEMVSWMNRVGYDAMALGNHEMYWGSDRLGALAASAEFPLLCANLEVTPGGKAPFASAAVRTVGGLRVLFVGAVTWHHLPYPDYPWVRYVDPAIALQRAIEEARSRETFDLIVALGHVRVSEAAVIVEAVPWIDVFVSGHSHEETREPIRVGGSFVVQSGSFAEHVGRLRLSIDATGAIEFVSNDLLPTEQAPTDNGRGLLQFLAVTAAFAATVLLALL